MVGVAQLVELRIVIPVVAGSIPVAHPIPPPYPIVASLMLIDPPKLNRAFAWNEAD